MERIAIAGISLHDTDVGSLERVARPRDGEHSRFLLDLADDLAASEVVLLATCNRVEVIFARETGHFPGRPDLGVIADYLGRRPTRCVHGCGCGPGAMPHATSSG